MEPRLKHSPVVKRIHWSLWETIAGVRHVLVGGHAGTVEIKTYRNNKNINVRFQEIPTGWLLHQVKFNELHTSRQTIVTVRVVQLPVLVDVIRLRWRLDVEKRSWVVSSLLSIPKCVWLLVSI